MKPVIITLNSDGKVVMSVDEFKRHMDNAYNQGYSDGNSSHSIAYYNAPKNWWEDLTVATLCDTTSHPSETTTTTTATLNNVNTIDDNQMSISDYVKTKGGI